MFPFTCPVQAGTGVFVGASYTEYVQLVAQAGAPSTYTASGGSLSVIAGRLSSLINECPLEIKQMYPGIVFLFAPGQSCCRPGVLHLWFHGTVHGGRDRLLLFTGRPCFRAQLPHARGCWRSSQRRDQPAAPPPDHGKLCGSRCVAERILFKTCCTLHPMNLGCPYAGMLAPDGRCKTLDTAADGYVRAEAACSLIVRSLNSLEASTPCQPAASGASTVLVLGVAVNQDGRSSSLTAPNGPAQSDLIASALQSARLSARMVGGRSAVSSPV